MSLPYQRYRQTGNRIIFKFDRTSNLKIWEESECRRQWLARAESLRLEPARIRVLTGLNLVHFTHPQANSASAPLQNGDSYFTHFVSSNPTSKYYPRAIVGMIAIIDAAAKLNYYGNTSINHDLCSNAKND